MEKSRRVDKYGAGGSSSESEFRFSGKKNSRLEENPLEN